MPLKSTLAAASAAAANANAAAAANATAGNGTVTAATYGGGQQPTAYTGKLVMNTNVHGLEGAAGRAALEALLALLRTNPALVFPAKQFGRMHLEGVASTRLVPNPAFKSPCEGAPASCCVAAWLGDGMLLGGGGAVACAAAAPTE